MTTLAPKLPWTHPYAPGYPNLGSQWLPTDPDTVDYLQRLYVADGNVGVEVGVAQAIDVFVRGCKSDNAGYSGDPSRTNWDAIQACCIMAGARTISGALVPLKGTAPTPYNFTSSDYSRSGATPGLIGNGSTKYLDTNRAVNADGDNDHHIAAYVSGGTVTSGKHAIGAMSTASTYTIAGRSMYSRESVGAGVSDATTGLCGVARSSPSEYQYIKSGLAPVSQAAASVAANISISHLVFGYRNSSGTATGVTDARLAFYSLGAAIDLAALDTRVTNLVTAIRFHTLTGLLPNDCDPATIAYITAAYAAGGTL